MSIPVRPDEDEDVFISDTIDALRVDVERLTAREKELEGALENAREDWRTAYARLEQEDARVGALQARVTELEGQKVLRFAEGYHAGAVAARAADASRAVLVAGEENDRGGKGNDVSAVVPEGVIQDWKTVAEGLTGQVALDAVNRLGAHINRQHDRVEALQAEAENAAEEITSWKLQCYGQTTRISDLERMLRDLHAKLEAEVERLTAAIRTLQDNWPRTIPAPMDRPLAAGEENGRAR